MKIAFDAKRIFQNRTGLGNYSRTLVSSLSKNFPNNEYYLYAPKKTSLFNPEEFSKMQWIGPKRFLSKLLPAIWRSRWVSKDITTNKIDIYHGLSHEIPYGIEHTNTKTVVTIHDLIFERYPKQYNPIDILIYRKKFKNACKHATHIIAISEQTKNDIIDFYKIDSKKISVCYQSCNDAFFEKLEIDNNKFLKNKYELPSSYFLYVGSIIERKNLLSICKAMLLIEKKDRIPVVIIGKGKKYMKKVKAYIHDNGLEEAFYFLNENDRINHQPNFLSNEDLAEIYRSALALIYPSIFEGFGIPILEAMAVGTPVITSAISCMPEVGGDAVLYTNPFDENDLANKMISLIQHPSLRNEFSIKGKAQAQKFTSKKCAEDVMNVYLNLQHAY